MKPVIKQSMKTILIKYLNEFLTEKEKDFSTVEHYAHNCVEEIERYLKAYNEFKED